MKHVLIAVTVGVTSGIALFVGMSYLWLLFGADPANDPLISF